MAVVALTAQVFELHRSSKIRVLAVTSRKRLAAAPELLTAAEAGLPQLTVTQSVGLLAPAGTPKPIIDQIAQATKTALSDPGFQNKLIELGLEPVLDSSPVSFRRSLEDDIASWKPIVNAINLKID